MRIQLGEPTEEWGKSVDKRSRCGQRTNGAGLGERGAKIGSG